MAAKRELAGAAGIQPLIFKVYLYFCTVFRTGFCDMVAVMQPIILARGLRACYNPISIMVSEVIFTELNTAVPTQARRYGRFYYWRLT